VRLAPPAGRPPYSAADSIAMTALPLRTSVDRLRGLLVLLASSITHPAFDLVPEPVARWKRSAGPPRGPPPPFRSPSLPGTSGAIRPRRSTAHQARSSRPIRCPPRQRRRQGRREPLRDRPPGPDKPPLRRAAAARRREDVAAAKPERVAWKSRCSAPLLGRSALQIGDTIGMEPPSLFRLCARQGPFVDSSATQGNDFQSPDAFWAELNRLTAAFAAPGRLRLPARRRWSGTNRHGGDRQHLLSAAMAGRSALVAILVKAMSACRGT